MPDNIANLPSAIANVLQRGILAREIAEAMKPGLNWQLLCQRERHEGVAMRMGETVTKTKAGLIQPSTKANAKLAAGGDPAAVARSVEQYSYSLASYGNRIQSHLPSSALAMVEQFIRDAKELSVHAQHTLNRLRRDAVYAAYGGGNSFATAAGTGATALVVADAAGFDKVQKSDGTLVDVSSTNPGSLKIAGGAAVNYTAVDLATNTITLSAAQTWAAYDSVVMTKAPRVVRQNSRATDRLLVAGDTPTIATFRAAATHLRNHNVPPINAQGDYAAFVDGDVLDALFADAEFHDAIRGQGNTGEMQTGAIGRYAGILFMPQPKMEMPIIAGTGSYQTHIHRSLVFGAETCMEVFAPEAQMVADGGVAASMNHVRQAIDEVLTLVIRAPQDYLGRILDLSWVGNVDWCVPTDSKNLSGDQLYKRAVVVHTAGPASDA